MEKNSNLIYFNNNGGTVMDPEVERAMEDFTEKATDDLSFIKAAVKEARQKIADLLNCSAHQLIFTKSTSDGIQLGIKAVYETLNKKGNHIITNISEHPAILKVCEELKKDGAEVTYLEINKEGLIDTEELKNCIRPTTVLIAIMAANNETGVIQPVEGIAEICKELALTFFSDGSQYIGKMRCEADELGFDLTAFSAYKMYGPKEVGILYVKDPDRFKNIQSTISETDPASAGLIVGMGKMAEICQRDHWENSSHISKLKNYFEHQLLDVEGLRINGSTRHRLYNTSNIQFPNNKVSQLADKFVFSHNRSSHVLKAMGLNEEEIKNSFRFSFGKFNTMDEVKTLTTELLSIMSSETAIKNQL